GSRSCSAASHTSKGHGRESVSEGCRPPGLSGVMPDRAALPQGDARRWPARYRSPVGIKSPAGLFVITNTAAQIADLGYEANLRERRRCRAGLWKHVARHLSNLTFRLLRCGVDCLAILAASGGL